ncbi:aminopeptidase [Coralloluteibacterium stylophorae]|uniref:Aminopeptidase n=1 Tax=Coralloluteibacterium stylophorae TaxID=1776034 RepID=A0A8J7VV15_9GAMM|nr:aminopeptidase [Coralloluteibacterium stylophorae]
MGLLALGGCSTLGYYGHLARGQLALLRARTPIERVLAAPGTDPGLRLRLAEVLAARRFAVAHLGLPDNASYTGYVALDRPFVSWAVYAAPEFSVEPVPQCFPLAGCVPYRGYFDRGRARAAARRLEAQGLETWIGGVPAYSTLGWFDDPVLSSMLADDQDALIETLFHELAHQWLYVRDDAGFNESLASFVGRQGLAEWRAARGEPAPDPAVRAARSAFVADVLALRARLRALYRQPLRTEAMRARKREAFATFAAQQRHASSAPQPALEAWLAEGLNNATLAPFGIYDRWVPAFAALFEHGGRDWSAFRAAAEAIARMPADERVLYLDAWLAAAARDGAGRGAPSVTSPSDRESTPAVRGR